MGKTRTLALSSRGRPAPDRVGAARVPERRFCVRVNSAWNQQRQSFP